MSVASPSGPDGFSGIRLESIGGLGAHLGGKMLGAQPLVGAHDPEPGPHYPKEH